MLLTTTRPTNAFHLAHRRPQLFNQVFNQLFDTSHQHVSSHTAQSTERSVFAKPKANISEHSDSYQIEVEMPGFNKKDVDILIEDNLLSVEASKATKDKPLDEQQEAETGEPKTEQVAPTYISKERHERGFKRYFSLSKVIDKSKIEATMNDGVLILTLAKKLEEKTSSNV